jgi:hypothetical protein
MRRHPVEAAIDAPRGAPEVLSRSRPGATLTARDLKMLRTIAAGAVYATSDDLRARKRLSTRGLAQHPPRSQAGPWTLTNKGYAELARRGQEAVIESGVRDG